MRWWQVTRKGCGRGADSSKGLLLSLPRHAAMLVHLGNSQQAVFVVGLSSDSNIATANSAPWSNAAPSSLWAWVRVGEVRSEGEVRSKGVGEVRMGEMRVWEVRGEGEVRIRVWEK